MHNSYDVGSNSDATVTTVPHQRMQESPTNRANENTSLSPNNNQTYYNERVQVPETSGVSCYYILSITYLHFHFSINFDINNLFKSSFSIN